MAQNLQEAAERENARRRESLVARERELAVEQRRILGQIERGERALQQARDVAARADRAGALVVRPNRYGAIDPASESRARRAAAALAAEGVDVADLDVPSFRELRSATELIDRLPASLAQAREAVRQLGGELTTSRRELGSGDPYAALPSPLRPADTETAQDADAPDLSAAQSYLDTLRQQLDAASELTHVQALQRDLAAGRLGAEDLITTELRGQLLAAARPLDDLDTAKTLVRELADAEQQRTAAAKAAAAASARVVNAEADLAGPYERARDAAERWRAETLAALQAAGADVEHYGARVEAVFSGRIAAAAARQEEAVRTSAEAALRSATDWQSGVIRGLRDRTAAAPNYTRT